jgi:uncharacterized protein
MMTPLRILLASALLGLSGHASAASFDCGKARAPDERAICADRALNDRDVRMALLYQLDRRFLAMGGRGALMDQQQLFLRQRSACGAKTACLKTLYDRRIADLRAIIDKQVYPRGPF